MSLPSVTAVGASILPRVLARRWNSSEGINGSGSSLKYSLRTPETTFTSAVLSLVTASRRSEWDTFSFFLPQILNKNQQRQLCFTYSANVEFCSMSPVLGLVIVHLSQQRFKS